MTEQNINKASLYHFLVSLKMFCPFSFQLFWAFIALCGRSLLEGAEAAVHRSADRSHSRCRAPALGVQAPGVHVGAHWLGPTGPWARRLSVGAALGLSCSAAWGILPDRRSNLCPLHWQADSRPLCHQGSPRFILNLKFRPIEEISSKSHTIIKLEGRVSCK